MKVYRSIRDASHTVVGELLKAQKFSLQANRKTREGADNPDRDAQFGVINEAVTTAMAQRREIIPGSNPALHRGAA
jgi:hypothetical protein